MNCKSYATGKDFDSIIYNWLRESAKAEGKKAGGLQMVSTWRNCILTNGEFPISNSSSGGGAVNRIIEIDCKDTKLFTDPIHVVDVIRRNHGYAGQAFIELATGRTKHGIRPNHAKANI